MIRIGPAGTTGLGYINGFDEVGKLGLSALEVPFTYGVHMKKEDAIEIGKYAKKLGISLSVHAPYYVNLASLERPKVHASVARILKSCEMAHHLGAGYVVFHPGFYQKREPEAVYDLIEEQIIRIMDKIKEKKYKTQIAPETTGRPSQFGSLQELLRLREETGCHITVDFSHLRARQQGLIDYDEIVGKIKGIGHIHAHFSGIEWGEKGERRHIRVEKDIAEPFLCAVHKLDITIICESPEPFEDAVKMKDILDRLN